MAKHSSRHMQRDMMKICGACKRQLPDDSYSVGQRGLRQSMRRCLECVSTGNQLELMMRGRVRAEEDTCPVCELPLPVTMEETTLQPCCMKRVCIGCSLESRKCGINNCPFCRTDIPNNESLVISMVQKRVAVSDPTAMCFLGIQHEVGGFGLEKDTGRAMEMCHRAARLGSKDAHHILGELYGREDGVGGGRAMALQHYEEAAKHGHVIARYRLGVLEYNDGQWHTALQHFLISAKLGDTDSLSNVKRLLVEGIATKDDYAGALQGYKAAVEEMTSPSRDEAKNMKINMKMKQI